MFSNTHRPLIASAKLPVLSRPGQRLLDVSGICGGMGGNGLVGSSIRRMAPATQAADRRTTNSKPSLETKVTYSEGWEAMMEVETGVVFRK